MTPFILLALTLCITAAVATWRRLRLLQHRRRLQSLATAWHMHYSPADRFGLADGIVQRLPVVGASDVRVIDLIYGNELDAYRYLLCVEFTVGVTYSKKCWARVLTFREDKVAKGPDRSRVWSDLAFGDPEQPRARQYEDLYASAVAPKVEVATA